MTSPVVPLFENVPEFVTSPVVPLFVKVPVLFTFPFVPELVYVPALVTVRVVVPDGLLLVLPLVLLTACGPGNAMLLTEPGVPGLATVPVPPSVGAVKLKFVS